jgi:hypothetical protein
MDLPGLRAQAEALLAKANSAPPGPFQITAEEHSTLTSLADAFSMKLEPAALHSAEGVASVLRLVLAAMKWS